MCYIEKYKKFGISGTAFAKKKIAAYARVSLETDRLAHSLSAQTEYYSEFIRSKPDWELVGIYADSFISGTETSRRSEFRRLISDCENGRIDVVLCKSISRFARNTVDLLETVRHLKELGVEVRFEKENIRSLSDDGELLLTILASFAQEDIVLQKTFVRDFITHARTQNRGELPQYRMTGCHEAIIDNETFAKAQDESRRRAAEKPVYCFSGRLICGICGKPFTRFSNSGKYVCWHCRKCNNTKLKEDKLKLLLGLTDQEITENMLKITVYQNGRLNAEFYDGRTEEWQYE